MVRSLLTIGLLILVVFTALSAPEQVLVVDGSAPPSEDEDGDVFFKTITAALAAAEPGATLRIEPGRYGAGERFPLVLDKPLRIESAASGVVIDAEGAATVIEVRAGDVVIQGLKET